MSKCLDGKSCFQTHLWSCRLENTGSNPLQILETELQYEDILQLEQDWVEDKRVPTS